MITHRYGPRITRGETSLGMKPRGLEWMRDPRRACAGLTEMFLSDNQAHLREAVRICHTCPFEQACDEHATSRKECAGVWGGRNRGPVLTRQEGARSHERQQLPEGATAAELVNAVLMGSRGRFGDLPADLQQQAAAEGIRRIGLGKLAHKLGIKAAVLYELAHGRPIDARIQELYDLGRSDEQIGEDVGLTARMIRQLRGQFGIVAEGWKKVAA